MKADIFVAIPSTDLWRADFGMCLMGMVMDFLGGPKLEGVESPRLVVDKREGSLLPANRHKLVRMAQKQGCSHILFIDTDQTFPSTTLRELWGWHKDVVACNIATKREPSNPTARLKSRDSKGRVLYTLPGDLGLHPVWRVGCGVMMVDLGVFGRMNPPWFTVKYKGGVDDYQGEDWGFCECLELHGIPIYVDQGLSWRVKHQGKRDFGHDGVELPLDDPTWKKIKELAKRGKAHESQQRDIEEVAV